MLLVPSLRLNSDAINCSQLQCSESVIVAVTCHLIYLYHADGVLAWKLANTDKSDVNVAGNGSPFANVQSTNSYPVSAVAVTSVLPILNTLLTALILVP